MWILRFLTAVLGLFGRARSPAMMLNLTVPRSGYRVQRDFAYVGGRPSAVSRARPALTGRRRPLSLRGAGCARDGGDGSQSLSYSALAPGNNPAAPPTQSRGPPP